ncbi:MAG: DUF488 domain-containing protein [Kiloniellales bacterium]
MDRRSKANTRRGASVRDGATKTRATPRAKGTRIRVKRAYEAPSRSDGCRVLVDRIWPRGRAREDLRIDDWVKDLAPSDKLRQWFGHEPVRWDAFKARYFRELNKHPEEVQRLLDECARSTLTLVFGAKDVDHNNAVALKEFLERRLDK